MRLLLVRTFDERLDVEAAMLVANEQTELQSRELGKDVIPR